MKTRHRGTVRRARGVALLALAATGFALAFAGAAASRGDDVAEAAAATAGTVVVSIDAGKARSAEPVQAPVPREANTPADVRCIVQRCRATTGTDAGWLRELALNAGDPLVAGNALQALGNLRLLVGDTRLCSLIDDRRLRLRQEVVAALRVSGDAAARPWLEHATHDQDASVRALASAALAELSVREAAGAQGPAVDERR